MPVGGTVLLAVIAGWLSLSVALAFALGRAIRTADRRGPRKMLARHRRGSHHRADPRPIHAARQALKVREGHRGA